MPDQFKYREAVPGYIWTITRPFQRFKAKVGGRASLIRLANGDVFVLSPVPLEEGTRSWVDTIGPVKYLVAPDVEVPSATWLLSDRKHYMSLGEWKTAYPDAEVIGPKGLDTSHPEIKFDFLFTESQLERTFGDNEITAHFFPGFKSKEIAFLHIHSKTFLNADLAENLPAKEAYSTSDVDPTSGFRTGLFMKMFSPNNWLHNVFLGVFVEDKT